MLDFDAKIYKKILDLAIKHNIVANCREYPSLTLNRRKFNFNFLKNSLSRKFNDQRFIYGLYVHFPFCASRCAFCKYYSEVSSDKNVFDEFLNNLERELELYKVNFSNKELDNLFFGGGTPTMLDERQIERYLGIIYRFFRFKKNTQITIEGTPESLNINKLKLFKKFGINRISIGLQSSNNNVLRKIGRRHTVKDVFKAFKSAREAGIKIVGTEVIWGLPGESLKTYKKTIKDIIKLSPEYIEGYLFTTGGRVKINRYYPPKINIDKITDLYREQLFSNGYRVYSSNNFFGMIKKGVNQAKAINQNTDGLYNYRTEVLGIGPGASSHFHDYQYNISPNVNAYINCLKKREFPPIHGVYRSIDDYKRLYIIMQIGYFRSMNKERYKQLFGKDLKDDFPEEIVYLKNKKIIKETLNQYKWLLDEHEMGHKSFFMHVIQYWYSKEYIRLIIKEYL